MVHLKLELLDKQQVKMLLKIKVFLVLIYCICVTFVFLEL